MKNISQFLVVVVVAALCGCAMLPGSRSCPAAAVQSVPAVPAQAPLKAGVYADKGPGGIGAVEWFRLVHEAPEMELKLLDGEGVPVRSVWNRRKGS